MIYVCRQRGALGVATTVVEATDVTELATKRPELEPLAAFCTQEEVNRFARDMWGDRIWRQEYERGILQSKR